MTDDEEMAKLKEIYDELWRDAKTMVKDMRRSIGMYLFSGALTLALAFLYVWYAMVGILGILARSTNYLTYVTACAGVIGTVLFILSGLVYLRVYLRLRKRYAKLIEMDQKIEG
jgi:hypothetical protein